MTMKKLTLSADERVIEQAKKLAEEQGTSVSAMFERIVRMLARRDEARDDIPPGSITARVTGIISLPKGKTDRQALEEALSEKYGLE